MTGVEPVKRDSGVRPRQWWIRSNNMRLNTRAPNSRVYVLTGVIDDARVILIGLHLMADYNIIVFICRVHLASLNIHDELRSALMRVHAGTNIRVPCVRTCIS